MKYLSDLYVFQLLGLLAVLSLASEAAVRRGADPARLRLAWNWLLLLSFAACVLTGFGLFVPMDKPVSRVVFKLHIWTGAVCGWAGLYHSAKRMKAMLWPAALRGRPGNHGREDKRTRV
ncbi:MAG: hypothetical protein AB1734_03915 [Elusimicrobiota bacterium]|jgi:hypothetical protein